MGPLLGVTFGSAIRDWHLARQGLKGELIGSLTAILCGAIIGLLFVPLSSRFAWPTLEMSSRGEIANLIVGCVVAFASGVGLCQ